MRRVVLQGLQHVAAAAFFAVTATGAAAQGWTAPRPSDEATRAWERTDDPSAAAWQAQAKKAAQAALQALLARNDANLASLPAGFAEDLAMVVS